MHSPTFEADPNRPPIGAPPAKHSQGAHPSQLHPKRQRGPPESRHRAARPPPRHSAEFADWDDDTVDRYFTFDGQPAEPILCREVRYTEAVALGVCKRCQGLTCTGAFPSRELCDWRHWRAHCLPDGRPLAHCPLAFRARMLTAKGATPYHVAREQARQAAASGFQGCPQDASGAAASGRGAPGASASARASPPQISPAGRDLRSPQVAGRSPACRRTPPRTSRAKRPGTTSARTPRSGE